MVKAILYDIDGQLRHYILLQPFRAGFHFAFGITKDGKATFMTKWSERCFLTENDAIIGANMVLAGDRPSSFRDANEHLSRNLTKRLEHLKIR